MFKDKSYHDLSEAFLFLKALLNSQSLKAISLK